jgi:tRNA 2-selenouridine synthase
MNDWRSVAAIDALRDLQDFGTIVDVRSASEYALDHIPGAINCAVLDDRERAEVGTLDRQQSSFEARRRGAAMVARNIARHLETTFASMPRDWRPLVYCWRGGNRSGAMTQILGGVGWPARQLEGGYRAFRRQVVADLETLPTRIEFRVVCGTTGSGKSRLLQQLQIAGAQVLDLEGLANHRGSVLGRLPSSPQPSQKFFESRLWLALRSFDPSRPVFVEAESRKVGELRVPDVLLDRMRAAQCIRVELPFDARVRLLRTDYVHFEQEPSLLFAQLDCLVALHGRQKIGAWKALATAREWDQMVESILRDHYDPAYLRSMARNFPRVESAARVVIANDADEDFARAALELARRA